VARHMALVEWPVRHLAGLDLLSLRLSHSFPLQTHTFLTTVTTFACHNDIFLYPVSRISVANYSLH